MFLYWYRPSLAMWLLRSSTHSSKYFSMIGSWIFCHVRCFLLLITSYKASRALCFFPTSINSETSTTILNWQADQLSRSILKIDYYSIQICFYFYIKTRLQPMQAEIWTSMAINGTMELVRNMLILTYKAQGIWIPHSRNLVWICRKIL
jgi:hypothetical protein